MADRFFTAFRTGALALCGAVALASCGTTPAPRVDRTADGAAPLVLDAPTRYDRKNFIEPPHLYGDEPVRVGFLLPFSAQSEDVRAVAASLFDAAQLAAFTEGDRNFLLIPKDTKGEPGAAAAAARSALSEGAEILLGPLFSESVLAVAEVARAADVSVIAFSSDLDAAGNGVYLLSHPPELEIARVTEYAVLNGYDRFGLLAPYTTYGERVSESFAEEVFARGGVMVHTERYVQDPQAMLEPARRFAKYSKELIPLEQRPEYQESLARRAAIAAGEITPPQPAPRSGQPAEAGYVRGYNAVMLAEQGTLLRALAPLLPYYDVDISKIKLLGVSMWNNPQLTREPALRGGWFAAPDPEPVARFERRYEQVFGAKPSRLASLAYDATQLSAALARERNRRRRFSPEAITNPAGFLGEDGLFRLRPDGRIERGLAVLELTPNGIEVIDPAPRTFAAQPDYQF
ncbi:MAG: penicillin-binding protein activator [Pseudomonadota bacterium]